MYTAYIVNSSHQKINHCENSTYFSTEKEVRHWLICKGDFTADLISSSLSARKEDVDLFKQNPYNIILVQLAKVQDQLKTQLQYI